MGAAEGISVIKILRWIWNTLFHQAVAVIAVYVVWVGAFNYTSPLMWHVILTTLGYIPLMAESILLFSGDNVWTQGLPRKKKYWLHGILITFGTGLITVGIALEIKRKEDRGSSHFVSDHAITGLASLVLLLVSLVLGVAAANSQALKNILRPVWFKCFHNFLGTAGYIIGIISLIYSYDYITSGENKQKTRTALICATSFLTILSLQTAVVSAYNQMKMIFTK